MKRLFNAALAATTIVTASLQDAAAGEIFIEPSGTYMFASKDGQDLYMDVYDPAEGSATTLDGRDKPTVIFMFGGGFKEGERNKPYYTKWFKMMTDNGYRVVSIDYRLGLKGETNVGIAHVDKVEHAISIAVEDLYSATAFIVENAQMLGVNPANIVISGSSAGAISVLQADYLLCNSDGRAAVLPDGFRYAGVMSFAGAVFSRNGTVKYAQEPSPTLLFHGTVDKVVNYKQIWFFNLRLAGSSVLCRTFEKGGYNYNFYRFFDCSHEIASCMEQFFPEEIRFLETNVIRGQKRIVDAMVVSDPVIPESQWKGKTSADLYKD